MASTVSWLLRLALVLRPFTLWRVIGFAIFVARPPDMKQHNITAAVHVLLPQR